MCAVEIPVLIRLADLAFAVSHSNLGRELHILLVFMILILAIVLCHSLIRFIMAVIRDPRTLATNRIPSRSGHTGYAQPERPIPVVLAGDEEALHESEGPSREKVTVPPPAYGLWRSSVVRADPSSTLDDLYIQLLADVLMETTIENKPRSPVLATSRAGNASDVKAHESSRAKL